METKNITNIEQFNKQYLYFRIPALTFLAFILPIGIVGNSFTIYIFGFRLKIRVVTFFLILMAISDLVCCLIGIPMEIFRLYTYYNYPNNTLCKIKAYIVFTCNIYSMIMLFILSMERYLNITRSTEDHISFSSARGLGTIMLILSSLVAIPVHAWSRRRTLHLNNGVAVHECVTFLEKELWYYYLGLLIFCIVTCMMIFILYWYVFLTVRIQKTWNNRMKSEAKNEVEVSMYQEIHEILTQQKLTNCTAIWITIMSLINHALYFIFILLRKLVTHLQAPKPLDYFLFILGESWVLHCTLNPFVYILLNVKFRNEAIKLLTFKIAGTNLESSIENIE